MNYYGIIIAGISFLCIGIFHPIVIKAEYYLPARCWPLFLITGIALLLLSTATGQILLSVTLGVLGCSCLWSILELKEQEKRVERGWFPKNPRRGRRRYAARTNTTKKFISQEEKR